MTWAEYAGSVFNTADSLFGNIYIDPNTNGAVWCSYGCIMNPDTGDHSYSYETIYPQTYSIQPNSGGSGQ